MSEPPCYIQLDQGGQMFLGMGQSKKFSDFWWAARLIKIDIVIRHKNERGCFADIRQ